MQKIIRVFIWMLLPALAIASLTLANFLFSRRQIARPGSCKNCNVIVISIGPLRAQSLPCYGSPFDSAPNLCRVAQQSLEFTRAFATASKTLDASFSVLTAQYPSTHLMVKPFSSELDPRIQTLPQLLQNDGYHTYFLGPAGDPHLPISLGFGRGFDRTFDADEPGKWTDILKSLEGAANGSRPFFAYLHTYDVHEPYVPDDADVKRFYTGPASVPISYEYLCQFTYNTLRTIHPDRLNVLSGSQSACAAIANYKNTYAKTATDFNEAYDITNTDYWHLFDALDPQTKSKYVHALYLARIYEFDQEFAKFWDYVTRSGLLEHTVVLITGDHGDEFGEHGGYSHGTTVYNETIHVPLIMSIPGVRARTVPKLASSVDIMPTLLSLVGVRPPDHIAGIDLLSAREHPLVVAEHVPDELLSIITSTYKLIVSRVGGKETYELYSLTKDFGEQHNIAESDSRVIPMLQKAYINTQLRFPIYNSIQNPLPGWLNEDQKKQLIHTGYF